MKKENIPKLNELSEKYQDLNYEKQDLIDAYRVALVYKAPKYKGGNETVDKFIFIDYDTVSAEYQLNIVNDLKRRAIDDLNERINAIAKEMAEL